MFFGVTSSGIVKSLATFNGIPTWSILILGSLVITERAEKSTRLPIRLYLIRPSFALILSDIDFVGLPPVLNSDFGKDADSLSKYVAI